MQDIYKINKKILSIIREMSRMNLVKYEIKSLEKYNKKLEIIREKLCNKNNKQI